MDTDEDFVNLAPLVPMMLPPIWDEPEEPAPTPRRPSAVSATRPAYGLVGTPASAVTTRDVKVFAVGAGIGGLLAVVFSWLGRRHG